MGPVPYTASKGRHRNIPLGPCLVELGDGPLVDVIWGANGQNCAALPVDIMASAAGNGHLVLLD